MVEVFTVAALQNGNMEEAARLINEDKEDPWQADTMRRWRREHRELYNKIADQVNEEVRKAQAEHYLGEAKARLEVSGELLTRLRAEHGQIKAKDLSTSIRNLDVGTGILTQRASELRDGPPGRVSMTFNFGETVRSLAAKGAKFYDNQGNPLKPEQVIEGSAEELPPQTN